MSRVTWYLADDRRPNRHKDLHLFATLTQRLALLGHGRSHVMPPSPLIRRDHRVSVVVPCYNYGHYLADCIASVLGQEDVDVDVLIIDDASPDGSGDVATTLAYRDPRIRVVLHDHNRGHIATFNEGLAQATGEFIVLLSADDLLTPGALSRAVAMMEARPSVGLVYGSAPDFTTRTPPSASTLATNWTVWPGADWLAELCRTGRNVITSPEVVMRTETLRTVGAYRASLPAGSDFEFWLRTAAVADIGRVNDAAQAYHRIHGENMSRTTYGGLVRDLEERRNCFESALADADNLPNRVELLELARRALAVEALTIAVRSYVWGATEEYPVEQLRMFAEETYPKSHQLALWRGLKWRSFIGPRWSHRNPILAPTELVHRVAQTIRLRRLRRAGV